ncbi:MAG: hypothetical protein ACOC9J_00325 [Persicimonas sp.]
MRRIRTHIGLIYATSRAQLQQISEGIDGKILGSEFAFPSQTVYLERQEYRCPGILPWNPDLEGLAPGYPVIRYARRRQ